MFDIEPTPYFSESHLNLKNEIQSFISNQIKPIWKNNTGNFKFPWEARELAAKAGLAGLDISTKYQGRGLDFISQGIAYEELGRLDIDARELIGSGHGQIIQKFGSEDQQSKWLPRILNGNALIGVGVTEENTGSDIRAIETKAIQSDKGYIILGKKAYISRINEADAFVIFAKTDDDIKRRSLSAFIVETDRSNIHRQLIDVIGVNGWSYGSMEFDHVFIPKDNLLGQEGKGFYIFEEHFSYWRILMSLLCIGAAFQTVDECIKYAKNDKRPVFGKELAAHPVVMDLVAEQITKLCAARLLCYQGLWRADKNLRFVREAAMNKWYGIRVAFEAVHELMQVFGARGYSYDYQIAKRFQDIRGFMIADGSEGVMKALIGREIFGKEIYDKSLGRSPRKSETNEVSKVKSQGE